MRIKIWAGGSMDGLGLKKRVSQSWIRCQISFLWSCCVSRTGCDVLSVTTESGLMTKAEYFFSTVLPTPIPHLPPHSNPPTSLSRRFFQMIKHEFTWSEMFLFLLIFPWFCLSFIHFLSFLPSFFFFPSLSCWLLRSLDDKYTWCHVSPTCLTMPTDRWHHHMDQTIT